MARPFIQHRIDALEDLFAKSKNDLKVLRQLEHELKHRQVPRAVTLLVKVRAALKPLPPTAPKASSVGTAQSPSQAMLFEPPDQVTVSAYTPTDAPADRSELGDPAGTQVPIRPTQPLPPTVPMVSAAPPAALRERASPSSPEKPMVTPTSVKLSNPTIPLGAPTVASQQVKAPSSRRNPVGMKPVEPPLPQMPLLDAYNMLNVTPSSTWESIEEARRRLVKQTHPSQLKSVSLEKQAQLLAEAKLVNAAYAVIAFSRRGGR